MNFLDFYDVFGQWKASLLDLVLRASHALPAPQKLNVVAITEEDYKSSWFKGTSPLCRESLKRLVSNILSGGAAALAIDLDVSAEDREMIARDMKRPLIWVMTDPENPGRRSKWISGPSRFPLERDGRVRFYQEAVDAKDEQVSTVWQLFRFPFEELWANNQETIPTFPYLIAHPCQVNNKGLPARGLLLRRLTGEAEISPIPSTIFFDSAQEPAWETLVGGKTVILGGTYPEARDSYYTTYGPMDGLNLVATAALSEMSCDPKMRIPEMPQGRVNLLELLFALGITLATQGLRRVSKWWFTAFSFALPILLSVFLFRWSFIWLNFLPMSIATFLENCKEAWKDKKEQVHEARHCAARWRRYALKQSGAAAGISPRSLSIQSAKRRRR